MDINVVDKIKFDDLSVNNTIAWNIDRFPKRLKLKCQDVYKDLTDYIITKYKNANLDLIITEENEIDMKEHDIKKDPYYKYTSVFALGKIECID